jgi:chemotaxis signal transduction protein
MNDLTAVSVSRSQAQILEQLNDEEFWGYAAEIAHISMTQDQAEEYLVCDFGARHCLFPLPLLGEIVPPPHQVTLLPAAPSWMHGVVVWRSEMIAVVDLKAYLWNGADSRDNGTDPAFIDQQGAPDLLLVVQFQDLPLGLLVSGVGTIIKFDEGHVVPFELAPDWCSALRPGVVRGVLDDKLVLDIPFIFNDIVQQIKE